MSTKPKAPTDLSSIFNSLFSGVSDHNILLAQHGKRYGVTLRHIKILELLTEIGVIALGFYAVLHGADPTITIALVATVVGGWKAVEVFAVAKELGQIDTDTIDTLREVSDYEQRERENK